jgi:hypothetical protein
MASRRKNMRWLAFGGVLALASAGLLGWAIPTMKVHDYWDTLLLFTFLVGTVSALTAAWIAVVALLRLQRQSSSIPKA